MQSKLPLLPSGPGGVRKSTVHGPWRRQSASTPRLLQGQKAPRNRKGRKTEFFGPQRSRFVGAMRRQRRHSYQPKATPWFHECLYNPTAGYPNATKRPVALELPHLLVGRLIALLLEQFEVFLVRIALLAGFAVFMLRDKTLVLAFLVLGSGL